MELGYENQENYMGRSIINLLAVIVMFVGLALVIAWKQQVLPERDAISYFSLVFAILATVHFLYAIYSGEISAKGLLVYRNQSPTAFYILLLFDFFVILISLYAVYFYGYVVEG